MVQRERRTRKMRRNEVLLGKLFEDEDVVAVKEFCRRRGQGTVEWGRDIGGGPDLNCLDRRGCVSVIGSD